MLSRLLESEQWMRDIWRDLLNCQHVISGVHQPTIHSQHHHVYLSKRNNNKQPGNHVYSHYTDQLALASTSN